MVPMIDVVFLLLVFFLLTANFAQREGFLPAELPRRVSRGELTEIEPLIVCLEPKRNGDCHVEIGNQVEFDIVGDSQGRPFDRLRQELEQVIRAQHRRREDPVKLMPAYRTKWDHVVKAYDVMWSLELSNIVFVMAD